MNHVIHDFYLLDDVDYKGRTLHQMWLMSREDLEKSHDVIQWMFPLNELSNHNKHAPILDDETIDKMKTDPSMVRRLEFTCFAFSKFLGTAAGIEKPHWVSVRNHNYLRISRAIKCCEIFGVQNEFYHLACNIYRRYPDLVGDVTKKFWDDAAGVE